MLEKTNPKIWVIIGVIFVSFSAIFAKISQAPSLIIAFYRMAFTVLLLLPSMMKGKIPELKKINKRDFMICVASGVFLALHFATWISSIKYTSIASSAVLVDTHPIFVVMGSTLFFKEKINPKALLGIGIAFLGGIIISLGDSTLGSNILYGDMLALAGAIFVAAYFLIGRAVRQRLSAPTYTFLVYTSATIVLFLMVVMNNIPLYPYPLKEWMIFLALAIFCTLLGHSIFNWALEYVKPTFVSTSILGEPVGAILWAILIFQEIPTLWQILGSSIIICGIYLFIKNNVEQKELKETK